MAKRQLPVNTYKVTYYGELDKRVSKIIKATDLAVSEGTLEQAVITFDNRGILTFALPYSSFIEAELVEDKAPITRLK